MGAGAAQTLINIHRVLPGRSVLMVGAGNVGLIVSYQLLQAGAEVVAVVEGLPTIGGYGVHASKIRRAGVPIFTGHTILRAE
jgi:NADPH-dependent 2,4-dienoyl-CoA reductase/sulfur reductase-like enzyme